jgi:PAS domain S-box-containing protein
MVSFWNKLSNIGVVQGIDKQLISRIRVTNQIVFSLSFISFCYIFIFYFLGYKQQSMELSFVVICMLSPILLNYFSFYFISRIWFIVAINTSVLIFSYIFGKEAGIHLVFFTLVCLPWIFFELKDWKYIISGTLISIIYFYVFSYGGNAPRVSITLHEQRFICVSVIFAVFIMISLCICFFAYQNNKYEQFLIEANENLKISERGMETILESIDDGFLALNKDWNFTYVNKEFEKLYNCKRVNIIGVNFWEYFPDAKNQKFYTEYHKAMTEQVDIHFEEYSTYLKKWLSVSVYPMNGGISIYFIDNTETQNYLLQIEAQNKSLKEIAWMHSHELRSPLASILGLIPLLNFENPTDPGNVVILEGIKTSAHELDEMVMY